MEQEGDDHMIDNRQKALLHIYKDAADLRDHTYRDLLQRHSGCRSAADKMFSQAGFEEAMAALETILFDRVARGIVPDPIANGHRHIRKATHWRDRLPARGYINSRQVHRITDLWQTLLSYLPPDKQTDAYFGRIITRATGKSDLGVGALTSHQAGMVINALKDRLTYAIRG